MKHGPYSPLKVFHHQGRIRDMKEGRRPQLLHVQLIPTNRCNMNCNFCAYRSRNYSSSEDFDPRHEIPLAKLLQIANELPSLGVRAVELTGGGEPTVHPGFSDLCLQLQLLKLDYSLVTNGSMLDEIPIRLAVLGAAWVRVSIDAGTAATYHETRGADKFNLVRKNLCALVRGRGNKREPLIGVGFVVTKDNWREVLQAAENAREDGVDNFRISAVFQNEGIEYFSEFHAEATALCHEAEKLSNGSFTVFNLFGERLGDLEQKSPSEPDCPLQNLVTYIGADRNVYRCCVLAYNRRGLLGSIQEQPFRSMWESEETSRALTEFDARRCPRCMFNGKNATIRYAIEKNPLHGNFL